MRHEAAPAPRTACKPGVLRHLSVRVEVDVVYPLIVVIVIPVHRDDALGDSVYYLLRHLGIIVKEILAVVEGAKVHIRPEHNVLVAVLLGYLANALKVALHDLADGLVAMDVEVLSSAEHIRLVHTYVYLACPEVLGKRSEHTVDELVGSLVVNKHNVVGVDLDLIPTEEGVYVSKCLHAGDDLDADATRKLVELAHL